MDPGFSSYSHRTESVLQRSTPFLFKGLTPTYRDKINESNSLNSKLRLKSYMFIKEIQSKWESQKKKVLTSSEFTQFNLHKDEKSYFVRSSHKNRQLLCNRGMKYNSVDPKYIYQKSLKGGERSIPSLFLKKDQ